MQLFKTIVEKKQLREKLQNNTGIETSVQLVKKLMFRSQMCIGTNYLKIMIEGNTGIYYAHPSYGHADYNKSRLFDKTPETIKLMNLFNSYINKHLNS